MVKMPKALSAKELESQLNYSKTTTPVTGVIMVNNGQIETFVSRKQLPPGNCGD